MASVDTNTQAPGSPFSPSITKPSTERSQKPAKTKATKRSRVDEKTEVAPTKKVRTKPERTKKKLDPRICQRSMPTCVAATLSGTIKDRDWCPPGMKALVDHKPRVMSTTQLNNVVCAFDGAKEDTIRLMEAGIPTVDAVEEARHVLKDTMRLVKGHIHPSFKMLSSTAFEDTKNGPMAEDLPLVLSFMAGCQRQMTAALAGKVEGALCVLARSVQVPPVVHAVAAAKPSAAGNAAAVNDDDSTDEGENDSGEDDKDDFSENDDGYDSTDGEDAPKPTTELLSQEY